MVVVLVPRQFRHEVGGVLGRRVLVRRLLVVARHVRHPGRRRPVQVARVVPRVVVDDLEKDRDAQQREYH